jgi:DNA polymerase sigma
LYRALNTLGASVQVAEELESSLGVLLLDFLRLYGRALDPYRAGVSVAEGGSFYRWAQQGMAGC